MSHDMNRAINDLMDVGGRMGADFLARREQRLADQALQAEYARALEAAKQTGEMPTHLQNTVPEDWMGEQAAIKKVLIRELKKFAPNHPLVTSVECRATVAGVTLIQYNRANRPNNQPYDNFAPDDETAQRIFKAFSGKN